MDIYILHYKYVKCTSLYTSTKDGSLTLRPNRSTFKISLKQTKQHIQIWFVGQKQAADLKPAWFSVRTPSLDKLSTTIYTSGCVRGGKKAGFYAFIHIYIYV